MFGLIIVDNHSLPPSPHPLFSFLSEVLLILGQRVAMHYSDPKPRANEDWLCNKVVCVSVLTIFMTTHFWGKHRWCLPH